MTEPLHNSDALFCFWCDEDPEQRLEGEIGEGLPSERDRVRAILIATGLILPAPAAPGQLIPEEREKLAERISGGTPLSQIIIEERGRA